MTLALSTNAFANMILHHLYETWKVGIFLLLLLYAGRRPHRSKIDEGKSQLAVPWARGEDYGMRSRPSATAKPKML